MNIHLPAILGFTRYQGFDPSPFNMSNSTEVQGVKHAVDSNRFNAASNQVEMFLLSIPLARGPVVDVAVDRHFVYSLGEVGPMLTSSAT